jgi:hypothetical protein
MEADLAEGITSKKARDAARNEWGNPAKRTYRPSGKHRNSTHNATERQHQGAQQWKKGKGKKGKGRGNNLNDDKRRQRQQQTDDYWPPQQQESREDAPPAKVARTEEKYSHRSKQEEERGRKKRRADSYGAGWHNEEYSQDHNSGRILEKWKVKDSHQSSASSHKEEGEDHQQSKYNQYEYGDNRAWPALQRARSQGAKQASWRTEEGYTHWKDEVDNSRQASGHQGQHNYSSRKKKDR